MIRVAFFCSQFGGGGAEMQMLRVMNAANFERIEVHLLLTRNGGNYESRLDQRIKVTYLNTGVTSSTIALFKAIPKLSKAVARISPSVLIAVMDAQNLAALATLHSTIPIVACCQNDPTASLKERGLLGRLFYGFIPKLYSRAAWVVATCEGVRHEYADRMEVAANYRVIANAGYDEGVERKSSEFHPDFPENVFNILTVGRLTEQKGLDLLIEAVSRLETDYHLWIAGRGPDEAKLRKQVQESGLENRVTFLGFITNPYPYYRAADLFVLSSRWEGFGNVITEAMACGTAVVSTDCNYGPGEILEDARTGFLVPVDNIVALTEQISFCHSNPALRERVAAAGKVRAEDFRTDRIAKQYWDLITETANAS